MGKRWVNKFAAEPREMNTKCEFINHVTDAHTQENFSITFYY